MDVGALVAVVVAVVVLVGLMKAFGGPHTVVTIADGHARVVRGQVPRGLVNDLGDVAAKVPDASGRITVTGRGETLNLRVIGLADPVRQRIRNVVLLYRDRLGPG